MSKNMYKAALEANAKATGLPVQLQVSTVEELDALPDLSVIRNEDWVWELSSGEWFGAGSGQPTPSDTIHLPVTVLYSPAVAG